MASEELLTPKDDGFHPAPGDQRWWHETWWFWFFIPERKVGGWLYNYVRPTIGVSGGGCWLWDDRSYSILDALYYANYSNLRMPEDLGPADIRFPSGTTVEVREPLKRYRLGHVDGEWIRLDLEYDAIMEPFVATGGDPRPGLHLEDQKQGPYHLDQIGRVTGEIELPGETLEVDCFAMRDRTWSLRPERWKINPVGYASAAASAETSFLFSGDENVLRRGYVVLDGRRTDLVTGSRRLERDKEHGYLTRIIVDGSDAEGRRLEAEGTSLSRMAMKIPGVHGVVWTSLVDWTINGIHAFGEDQDAWPIHAWTAFRRETLGR